MTPSKPKEREPAPKSPSEASLKKAKSVTEDVVHIVDGHTGEDLRCSCDDWCGNRIINLIALALDQAKREQREADIKDVGDVHKIQMSDPSSKTDSYMRGMANGLELAMTILENREPRFIEKPDAGNAAKEKGNEGE